MNFKKYEKELNKAGYTVSGDMVANARGDVVGQMDPYGEFHYSDDGLVLVILAAIRVEEKKPAKKPVSKAAPKKKRARDENGHFRADDPSTPAVNEAWED